MYRYSNFEKRKSRNLQHFFVTLFVLIYPMLVSIYTLLPPLIGLVGYIIIINLHRDKLIAFLGMFYLLNLDLNLTLPLLLSIFAVILIYMLFYTKLKLLISCHNCLFFILVIIIDFGYYSMLFIYDLMFASSTVLADGHIVYYIIVDLLLGFFV